MLRRGASSAFPVRNMSELLLILRYNQQWSTLASNAKRILCEMLEHLACLGYLADGKTSAGKFSYDLAYGLRAVRG